MSPLHFADLRAGVATALVLYLPGLFLARRVARASRTAAAAWAFPCSLALLLTPLFLGRILGLTLSSAGWILAFVAGAGALLSLVEMARRHGPEDLPTVRPAEWILTGAAVVALIALGAPLGLRFDSLDHLATIRRSLMGNAILPLDQCYRGGDGLGWDQRKGFLPALLAWVCRISGSDPLQLWRLLPAVLAPGILLAVSGLMRGWLRPGWRSDLALGLWILLGGGSGLLWLFRAGYPNHPGYALAFFALGLYISQLGGPPVRGRLIGIALLVYTAELLHIVPGVVVLLGAGLGTLAVLAGAHDRRGRLRVSLQSAGAAGIGLAAPLIFRLATQGPLASTLHTHLQGVLDLGGGLLVASPLASLGQTGWIAVFALALLPLAARRIAPELRLPCVVLTAGAWILVETPLYLVLQKPMGYLVTRFLDVIPAVPVVVLAGEETLRGLVRPRWPSRLGSMVAGLLILGLAGASLLRLPAAVENARMDTSGPESVAPFRRALEALPRTDPAHLPPPVVLADPFSSYAVPALTGDYVVSTLDQHGSPADPQWRTRLDDLRDMLYGGRGDAVADSLLRAYGVGYVFINTALPVPYASFGSQVTREMTDIALRRFGGRPELFRPCYQGSDGVIFQVVQESGLGGGAEISKPATPKPGAVAWKQGAAESAPVDRAAAGQTAAATMGAAADLDLGLVAAPGVQLPSGPCKRGQTVPVIVNWVRQRPITTDLPLWVHLRLLGQPPRRWYICPAWNRPGRLWAQARAGRFYTSRIAFLPLKGIRDFRSLPLGVPQPDTLQLYLHWRLQPGRYAVQMRLREETFLPNLRLRDLLRDDELGDAPVAGWITVAP